ncbi:alpha/beta hydrolase [Candidatus Saccharibacteria bacterium]|nr:alpha/beta hydrolase [Candidatus Saccharibacteria bacterium]
MKKLILTNTYDACRSGEPKLCVVMIHGIASDSTTYNAAHEYFEAEEQMKDVRFVKLDLLGSGLSMKDDSLNYDYDEQITALHNAILELKNEVPLVLVGHSLGTFIVTRYASIYPDEITKLILISPPVYTRKDYDNPLFKVGMEAFKKSIALRSADVLKEKAFKNSMDNIVMDRNNYDVLASVKVPTVILYGKDDQLIASYNLPGLLKKNSLITAVETNGKHGVSRDKYTKIPSLLKEVMKNETV